MCHDFDSRPPLKPITGAAVDHRDLVLTADDGNMFLAYEAYAEGGGSTGVVVLPDVRGIYPFYNELAVRLAEAGHDSVTIDYFGRTAGRHARAEDFPYQDHVAQTTYEGVRLDVAAAVELLHEDNSDRQVFTLGFCFGGSNSWQQAANGHGLAGAIGFYGVPGRENRPLGARSCISLASEMESPILALIGGDDPSIPPAMVEEFDQALTKAGVEHEIQVYPDTPHSFFDRKQEEFAEESADAWRRVLAFIDRYS